MEFEGVVYKIMPVTRGTSARGEWQRQDVVFDYNDGGQFSRKICVTFFNKESDVAKLREGETFLVSVNIESREYNGRWYTDIRAWRVQPKQQQPPVPMTDAPLPSDIPAEGGSFGGGAAAEVDDLPEDVVLLRQPLDHIYLVSTSVMDLFVHLDALDSIALSGTKAEGWYVEEAKQAMQEGRIAYAGKYSAPDYERILAAGCTLAIENTMVLHDPEVKEQLEKFGVPVLIERSSYESGPLARMEWLKLYGILLNKTEMAEEVFRQKVEQVAPILEQENTGKTAAFFSITTNNLITVRRTSDYVAQMVGMAGGVYIFDDLEGETSAQSTIKLPLETFYARARDADVLIYNSTIEGVMETRDQLIEKCPMLADFKAVQSGDCWCTAQSLFQQSMELADLISDMNLVFTEGSPDPASLRFLQRIV